MLIDKKKRLGMLAVKYYMCELLPHGLYAWQVAILQIL